MVQRTRTRNLIVANGYREIYISGASQGIEPNLLQVYDEECTDTADSPGADHAFSLNRFDAAGLDLLNGNRNDGGMYDGSLLNDYLPAIHLYTKVHLSGVNISPTAGDFAALKARTNPSRPLVTPLTLLQDVVTLPKMLKDLGKLIKKDGIQFEKLTPKEIASQNLAAQFGWMPLVQDIEHLMDLQEHIHKRNVELDRLYQKSGLKRRVRLDSRTEENTSQRSLMSGFAGTLQAKVQRFSTAEKWGTIRWKPTSLPPWYHDTMKRNHQVRRIISGFTPEGLAQGVWDTLPWTWLVDWFTNAGDYLLTHSNTVPAQSSHACVMVRRVTTSYFSPVPGNSPWITGGSGEVKFTSLRREVNGSLVPASLPYIGLRRLSILGSLFVQRFK